MPGGDFAKKNSGRNLSLEGITDRSEIGNCVLPGTIPAVQRVVSSGGGVDLYIVIRQISNFSAYVVSCAESSTVLFVGSFILFFVI